MEDFMLSRSNIRLLAGPIGGGKSVCCTHELLRWAAEQQADTSGMRRTKFLVVRNTRDQLMSTTWKTVTEWVKPGTPGVDWKATEKTLTVKAKLPDGTRMSTEWVFIPLDEPADIRKALSLEATGIWINEWRELHPELVDGLMSRTDRFPPPKDGTPITRAGGIFDTNMPDEETWHWEKMENPPANWSIHIQPPAILTKEEYIAQESKDPEDEPVIDSQDNEWYVNPQCDNSAYLSKSYYPNNVPGKKEDFIRTFLRCQYGRSLHGVPVYDKTFKASFHVAKDELKHIKSDSYPIIIGLDQGRTPAAVIGQMDTRGRLLIFDELTSENMGMETFINQKLKPLLYSKYFNCNILVAPDPASWQKSQVNEMSPADVLRKAGFSLVKPATNKPELRIQAVERFLLRQIDGGPAMLVSQGCVELVKGFRYGYRYKLNKKGDLDGATPEKNHFSHCHDACHYLCLVADSGNSGAMFGTSRARAIKPVACAGWT